MDIINKLKSFRTDIPGEFKEYRIEDSPVSRTTVEDHLPDTPQSIIKIPDKNLIRAFVVSKNTVFMALDDILPECSLLTKDSKIPRVICVVNPTKCPHISYGCIGKLLNRLGKIAKVESQWKLYILYWRLYLTLDKKKDRRVALVIWANTSDMTIINVNKYQLDYFLNRRGEVSEEFKIEMGFL